MDCPECDGNAQLLIGGGYFTHATGYACDDCGIVSDTGGRRRSELRPGGEQDVTGIFTRFGNLLRSGFKKAGR